MFTGIDYVLYTEKARGVFPRDEEIFFIMG